MRLIAIDANSDQQDFAGGCDYSNASIHDGWGWNAITGDSCPPLSAERSACVDSDGDGWGWDGIDSCVVN